MMADARFIGGAFCLQWAMLAEALWSHTPAFSLLSFCLSIVAFGFLIAGLLLLKGTPT